MEHIDISTDVLAVQPLRSILHSGIASLRPYLRGGKPYIARKGKEVPLHSSDGALFDVGDWQQMDTEVENALKPLLPVCKEFAACGLISNAGFSDTDDKVYRAGDIGVPLPFIHKWSDRHPSSIYMAAIEVAEMVERVVLGVDAPLVFEGIPLYGMCNHPRRAIQTITNPYMKNGEHNTAWSFDCFCNEIMEAKMSLFEQGYTGACSAFVSSDWFEAGINTQHFHSFKNVVMSPQLSKGTVVLCEMKKETMFIYCGQDIILTQGYPRIGTACEVYMAGMAVVCCIVPVIQKNHCGIIHMKVNSI